MNNYGTLNPSYQQPMRYSPINWVKGVDEAQLYQLLPNTSAVLMDSENEGIMYIKSRDNIGFSQLRVFKYTEITDAKPETPDLSAYVTKDEVMAMLKEFKEDQYEQSLQSTKSKQQSKSQQYNKLSQE